MFTWEYIVYSLVICAVERRFLFSGLQWVRNKTSLLAWNQFILIPRSMWPKHFFYIKLSARTLNWFHDTTKQAYYDQQDNCILRGLGCQLNNIYLVLVVFCSAAVGVGFYGNEDAHKGVSQFAKAGTDADNTIHTMKTQVRNPYKKHGLCSCSGQQYTATCTHPLSIMSYWYH